MTATATPGEGPGPTAARTSPRPRPPGGLGLPGRLRLPGRPRPQPPGGLGLPGRLQLQDRLRLPGPLRTWLQGWGAVGQLVLDLLLAGPYLGLASCVLAGAALIPAFLIGLPLLVATLAVAHWLAPFERARLDALTGVRVGRRGGPPATMRGWRRVVLDPRPWRSTGHLALVSLWGCLAGTAVLVLACAGPALLAVPLVAPALAEPGINLPGGARGDGPWWVLAAFVAGVLLVAVVPVLARALVLVDVGLARWLLGPSRDERVERLSERVETLTRTRAATVDSVETERRRIERDLHDGPQQRLVAIAMDLGMARERLDRDPDGARALLDQAHSASKEAITEMRMVARGIHPPVLTDRGLDAALSALAARAGIPVAVDVDLPHRPTPTLEAIAYFCVSEALTNVAKHSGARTARVSARREDAALVVRVQDDGAGGADPTRGTGLHGLADRVRAVDGSLRVDSPAGGPTVLTARLPWRET